MKPYNLIGWYWRALKNYAVFEGRAIRSEFWGFMLIHIIIPIFIFFATISLEDLGVVDDNVAATLGLSILVYLLGTILPFWAVWIRRLHDTNHSGWWVFIVLIPIIGHFILFIFIIIDGTTGPNRFGEDPKGRKMPSYVTSRARR